MGRDGKWEKMSNIKILVTNHNKTVSELARALDISRPTMYAILRGEKEMLPSQIAKLAAFLGVDMSEIVGDKNIPLIKSKRITIDIEELLRPLFILHNMAKKDKEMKDFYYKAYIGDEIDRVQKILKENETK